MAYGMDDIFYAFDKGRKAAFKQAMEIAQERGDHLDDKFVIGYNAAMRHVWTELAKLRDRDEGERHG